MKTRIPVLMSTLVLIFVLLTVVVIGQPAKAKKLVTPTPTRITTDDEELPVQTPAFIPTPPPFPTAGPESLGVRTAPIEKILTEDQVLIKTMQMDGGTKWDSPWSLQTRVTEPDRIKIKRYADSSVVGGTYGERKDNAVWVVAIRGKAIVRLVGWEGEADGVTYYFDEATGDLIQITGGYVEPK